MSLRESPVNRCLDRKLVMFGFEVVDLLAIFLCLSILNFIFGQTNMKLLMIWTPTLALALTLRIGKIGKPDKYLIHWIKFQVQPGIYNAFLEPSVVSPPPRLTKRKAAA